MTDADTPFVRLLQRYMWRVRTPPINPNKLANELGVSRTTVANWLNGTKPTPEMVPELARKMDIPMETIMRALDYPVVSDEQLKLALDALERWTQERSGIDDAVRQELLALIESARIHPDALDELLDATSGDSPNPKVSSLAR